MDQFYFEEGYLEVNYFTVVREAGSALTFAAALQAAVDIADSTGYYIPDYIAVDYFVGGGALVDATGAWSSLFTQTAQVTRIQQVESSQSAEFTQSSLVGRQQSAVIDITSAFTPTLTVDAFKNHTAVLDVVATMTSAGAVNRSANVLLDHIADLNAMAAKTVDPISTMAVTATQTTSATATKPTSASLITSSTLAINAGKLKTVDSQFTTISSIFVSRNYARPLNLTTQSGEPAFNTTSKFGSHSYVPNGITRSENTKSLGAKSTQDYAIEFYYNPGSSSAFAGTVSAGQTWEIDYTGSVLTYKAYIPSGGGRQIWDNLSYTVSLSTNTFSHIAVVRTGLTTSLFVNGVRRATVTQPFYTNLYIEPTLGHQLRIQGIETVGLNRSLFDEMSMVVGNTYGFNATSSTLTVPTEPRTNDPLYTRFLYHFNNDRLDDISLHQTGAASLTSTLTLSAQANANTKQAVAGLTSTATVTASGNKLQEAASTLTSAFSQTALIDKFRQFQSDLESAATFTVIVGSIKQFVISAGALFEPSVDADAQLAGVALLESQFTQSTSAVKTTDVISNIDVAASQSATATVTAGLASALVSTATLTSTVTRIQTVQSDLTSAFAITINNSALEQYSAALSSEFTSTVVADRFAEYAATLSSAFTSSTQAQRTRDLASALTTVSELSATVIRQQQAQSELVSAFTQSTNGVKDTDVVADFVVTATQISTVVKTVDAIPQLESIATQLTAVFKNATGTITLESQATLTAVVGQLVNLGLFSSGLDTTTGGYRLSGPVGGSPVMDPGYVIQFWAKRDTVTEGDYEMNIITPPQTPLPSTGVYQILQFRNKQTILFGGNVRLNHAVGLFYPNDADEPYPYWQNAVPQDTLWHHYLIRMTEQVIGIGTATIYTLWRDGIQQTYTPTYSTGNRGRLDNGGVAIGTLGEVRDFNGTNFDGALAQVWMGGVADFDLTDFYNGYAQDLTGYGDPVIYNLLTQPWLGVTGDTLTAATEPLYNANITARATMVVGITTAVFLVSNTNVTVTLVCDAVKIIDPNINITADCTVTAVITQTIGIVSNLNTAFTLDAEVFRIKQFSATITAQTTITAIVGATEQFNSNLTSAFTLDADAIVKPPVRAEAFLLTTATVTIEAASFTDTTTLMFSLGTLTADATLIPPIRITADLVAESTLTVIIGSIEQFAILTASAGTVTVNAVKTVGASSQLTSTVQQTCASVKFTGIILTLTAFNTQLTLGDVINLDPALTYVIPQETREYPILPESRLYEIQGESRELIILKG